MADRFGGWEGLTRRLGGPMGRYAGRDNRTANQPGSRLGRGSGLVYLLATLSWILTMMRQLPCHQSTLAKSPDRFGWMCYTDMTALYFSRGQATGGVPYASVKWEYPVLTGYFSSVANWLGRLFGAKLHEGIDGQQMLDNANIYFAISAVGLFACLLWLVTSQLRLTPDSPALAMLVAIAPAVWTTGLINWDLLAVALTAAGLAAWHRDRYVMAGVWWGLGVAAKLYPIVIVGALFILVLRPEARKNLRALLSWLIMFVTAVVTWLVVNLPVMATRWDGWRYFYTMNAQRGADLGSVWYGLQLLNAGVHNPATWSRVTMIIGYVLLAGLIYFARRPPTVMQIAYLAVVIMIVGNLVYSPQYVLWILPLIVIVRPKVVDLVIFTVTELVYWAAIWIYLGHYYYSGGSPVGYVVAIFIRLAGTLWVVVRVVLDVLGCKPQTQPEPDDANEPEEVDTGTVLVSTDEGSDEHGDVSGVRQAPAHRNFTLPSRIRGYRTKE